MDWCYTSASLFVSWGVPMALKYNANLEVQYPKDTLLGDIDPATREAIEGIWTITKYRSGQVILGAEETSIDVLFLLEGSVRVANFSDKGREVSFSAVDEGDCFGEFAVIDGAPRSASVVALNNCRVARVSDVQFLHLLHNHPDMCLSLMRNLVGKLRELTRRVSDFTALRADDRIRQEVIRLFRDVQTSDGSADLAKPPTQSELAAFVFTNREAVAREIGRMKKAGLVQRRGRGLFAQSVAALEQYQEELQDR